MRTPFPKHLGWCLVATVLTLLPTARLVAQQGAIELGIDSEMSYHILRGSGNDVFQMSLPLASSDLPRAHNAFRVGFFASDRVSIEPSVSLGYYNPENKGYRWNLGLATVLQYHLVADPARLRPYVGLGANVSVFYENPGAGTGVTSSQFGVSGEFGLKIPLQDRLGLRLAGGVGQFFRSKTFVNQTSVFGTLGVSYFTK
jgi:hypothetical protein